MLDLTDGASYRVRRCCDLEECPKSISQYSCLIIEGCYIDIFALQKCVEHDHCTASVCMLHIITVFVKINL